MSKPPTTPADDVTAPSEAIAKPASESDLAEGAKVADAAVAPSNDEHRAQVEMPSDLADELETGGARESTT